MDELAQQVDAKSLKFDPGDARRSAPRPTRAEAEEAAAVLTDAEHMGMSMSGVRVPGAMTTILRFSGPLRDDPAVQARFFALARRR